MSAEPANRIVSVIIPVLNGASTIESAVRAVLAQRVAGRTLEILVCDNGSTDGTTDIVSKLPVRLLHEPRRGPAAARNRALRHATGDVIACVDADMLPTHRWLERLTAPLENPAVRIVGGAVTGFQPSSPAERYAQTRGNYSRSSTVDHRRIPFVQGGNMAVRRADALAVGGWCDDMPSGEDVDFSIRMLQRFPSEIVYVADAMAFHRHRIDTDGLRHQARWWGRGLWHLMKRHPVFGSWNARKSVQVRAVVAAQSASAMVSGTLVRLGLMSAERAEFERYHSLWLGSYWAGFFEALRAAPGIEWSARADA